VEPNQTAVVQVIEHRITRSPEVEPLSTFEMTPKSEKIMNKIFIAISHFVLLSAIAMQCGCSKPSSEPDKSADSKPATEKMEFSETTWYYPAWAADAKYNQPIDVLDTDSALGRYSLKTKQVGLKDLVKFHGHPCDGLVIVFIQVKAVLAKLFPDGVIDRTDLRVVSKNGPCWVDTVAMMTGARINFGTLSLDNSVGDGFIIQRISTGEAYSIHLKDGVFPKEQAEMESKIRRLHAEGKQVDGAMIDQVETMADKLSTLLLNTPPEELLDIKELPDYEYKQKFKAGSRGDIINKNVPR